MPAYSLDIPPHFEVLEHYARFDPTGVVSWSQAVERAIEVIRHSEAIGVERLLVNVTGLSGFDPPNLLQRFTLAVKFASVTRSRIRIALVASPELLDPDRFGLTVARNRGLNANVFTDQAEALAWLLKT
jgi:hypothetical protein